MRPLLSSAVPRLWRDTETLQLGRPPGRAVVLAGIDPAIRSALSLLDGTRDREGVLREAASRGCPPPRTASLLSMLETAGVLDDAAQPETAVAANRAERDQQAADVRSLRLVHGSAQQPMTRRAAATVVVLGAGRVGVPVAALLAAAGVGRVEVVDDEPTRPEDCGVGGLAPEAIGRPRGDEARRTALRRRPGPAPRRPDLAELPDLVVIAPPAGLPAPTAPSLVPHLLAEVRGEAGIVGPLVCPGQSACLHCLELTRTDRDPGWPVLALQLDRPATVVAPCDGALALAVAAQTALQALAFLDGSARPATVGGTLELVLPDWRWRRRSWQLHPDCGCGWQRTGSGPTAS